MWFWKIMRRFFLSLDSVLFNFIDVLYDLLMSISRTSILTQGEIAQFAQRIELLLGIFMLFKLSFSLITYIVNPDDFSDKQKGFGKLIQSAVISLLMLVLVPYIFQMAFNLQTKVLEGNVLAKLILGEDDEAGGNDNFLNTAGEEMAFSVMLPFFKPNYSINNSSGVDLADCINIYESQGDKNVFSTKCKTALSKAGMETAPLENYSAGITERSLGLTFRIEAALSTTGDDDTEDFLIDYMAPISTVVAVVVCLLLVTFCIDIGVRNVKLAFLQLIYPIPVISYMDPKNGKDGLFKKWYQMCFSTFLSLFIRLLALYFGVYIISKVGFLGVYDVVTGSQITNGWVMIFVIIGVLMFVKQLPKILENLGIKLDGDGKFTLNPLKKLEEGAIGGKILKKPNEMLAKGAKGIAKAPFSAVGTFGRKGIAAFDSKKNGKGFRAGWGSQHGKMYNAYRKKKDEWMPHDAEAHKKKMEGRNEFDTQHKLWAKGRNAWEKVDGNKDAFSANGGESFTAFSGRTKDNFEKVYKHNGFVASKMRLEHVDAQLKDVQSKYDVATDTVEKEKYYQAYQKLSKAKESAQKDHDIMRKRYVDDADIEDALSYTKSTQGVEVRTDPNGTMTVENDNTAHDATSIHRKRNYNYDNDERGNDR